MLKQKSLDSWAKIVLDYRIATGYLLAEQGGAHAMANITCCTQMDTSREVKTQIHEIIEQASYVKKVTPSLGSSSDLLILTALGLGIHGSEVHSRYWELSCLL